MNQLYDPLQDSTPLPRYVEVGVARRRAVTAFWRGSVFGAILASGAFIASAAWSETINIGRLYVNGQSAPATTVTLEPSTDPGILATVTMQNEYVNQGRDDGTYTLSIDGLTIEARFTWDVDQAGGADRIEVTPPAGVTCEPIDCGVTVPEGQSGTIILFDWRGM